MSEVSAMRSVKTIRLSSLGLKVLAAYVVGALLSIALAVAAKILKLLVLWDIPMSANPVY